MKSKIIVFVLLMFLPGIVAGDDITPSFSVGEVYFDFNEPKGSVDEFTVEANLLLMNNDVEDQATFSGLTLSVEGITGISVSPEVTSLSIPAGSYEKVKMTFAADSSMDAGIYDEGVLKVSGNNVNPGELPLTVEIRYPAPTLNVTWSPPELGNVKAGSDLSYTLTVQEVMGYKSAKNVTITIYDRGPAENVTHTSGQLGDFSPLNSKDMQVNFSIPSRGIKPGTYSISPVISSDSTISAHSKVLNYTIPTPQIKIEPWEIDFGKITFELGKDTNTVTLTVSETGGYTPLEKLSVSLLNGESGWITYPELDYIPPGGSEGYPFTIFLSQDASLGLKSWELRLNTKYAGSQDINANVIVSFPGTDEAIASLKNLSVITNTSQEESLVQNTVSLLETSKGKTQLRKIMLVMSVYSGTHTFLGNLDTAANSENLVEAGDGIVRAKTALTKIEIGDQNLEDAELKIYSSKIVSSAREIWNTQSQDMLDTLKEEAENNEDVNYKLAALYYDRISRIYTILDDPSAGEYSKKQSDIEEKYQDALLDAGALIHSADVKLKSARDRTFRLGEDTYIVSNPFSYDSVSKNYAEAIDEYERAEALYRTAGEDSDADLLKGELEGITLQKGNIFRAFAVYGSLLALIFLWFVGRVVLGLQRYSQDEMEGRWGDVIQGEEISQK